MFVHLKNLTNKGYITQSGNKFRTLYLNVPNEYDDKNNQVMQVPLLGKVAAGNPIEAIENPDEWFTLPASLIPSRETVFTLQASGESMINVGIYDGDIIIVQKQKVARNGEIVVALIGDEATVKTFYKEKDHIRLQPENCTLDPIIVPTCEILGKVSGVFRKIK